MRCGRRGERVRRRPVYTGRTGAYCGIHGFQSVGSIVCELSETLRDTEKTLNTKNENPQDMRFRRLAARLGPIVLLAAVYFFAAKVALLLAIPPGYATAAWPPSGIALAAVLLFGSRIWPGIWLGAALINLTIQGSPLLAVLIGTGNTLEAVVAAGFVRPYVGTNGEFETGKAVVM